MLFYICVKQLQTIVELFRFCLTKDSLPTLSVLIAAILSFFFIADGLFPVELLCE